MTATGKTKNVGGTRWETSKGEIGAGVPVGGLNACKKRMTWRETKKLKNVELPECGWSRGNVELVGWQGRPRRAGKEQGGALRC